MPEIGIFRQKSSARRPFSADYNRGTLIDIASFSVKNILVIDDNDAIRNVIATVLADYGFQLQEAADGETGLQMIRDDMPSLVICDINMPGMDGYEVLSLVRQSFTMASVPFILMTGLMTHDGFRRGMSCGADDYLFKPFATAELIEAVMSRLARQSDVQRAAETRALKLHQYA